MVDLALKPSLARYEFREEREFIPAVSAAQDSDESVLAMVQQQADIAGGYLRSGDPRKAIATLRRAYKVAADHGGAKADGNSIPVARRLALASIRLQLCIVLSRLGRHDQAMSEARSAKHETDEVWRTVLGGCGELAEASEEGNLSKPVAPLRRLLLRPPRWLHSVVEASVQARQCIAVEAEFLLAASPNPSEEASRLSLSLPGKPDSEVAGSSAMLSGEEEMEQMHREAVMLARQLLPDGHHVREGAERAMLQSELRKQESLERVSRTRSSMSATHSAANLSPTAAAADFLLKSGRHRSVQPAALDATLGESTAQKLLAALDGNMGILKGRSAKFEQEPLDGPVTHESLFAPPGDVFNRSFKRNLFVKKKKKAPPPPAEEVARSSSPEGGTGRHRTDSVVSLSGTGGKVKAIGGPGVPREKDPFRAWKLEVMDVNKMTMKEIKSRSFEGIKEMQADIKRDNRRFRNLWLREMDEDLLYEDRTLYTPHGMLATEVAERKYDAWKKKAYKPSEYTLQKKEAQKKLFSYYGVPMSSSEPDLKAWGRVLRESHARTPAERERVRREQEAQRRKEEEARRREQEEQRAALAQAAGGVTEKLAEQKRRSSAVQM